MNDTNDSWRPSATLETLRLRAAWLKVIRQFFEDRGVLEVETPVLSFASVPDPNILSLQTPVNGQACYLQTSPELYMKRLLAAGCGPVFQVARVFRDGEVGRWHNPEFTLVEWYRPGFDQQQLMDEVGDMVIKLCEPARGSLVINACTYRDLFAQTTGINPLRTDWQSLDLYLESRQQSCPVGDDWGAAMDWLMVTAIQPQMRGLMFVTGFPATQASLAKLDTEDTSIAKRFELFIDGIEIANGFEELTDAGEQRSRFEKENEKRRGKDLPEIRLDEKFLQALENGLPETSGVALGLDRLLMWKLGVKRVQEAMSFGW